MVGQNIGKYQVLDRIGRGGMGTVYRAIDETLRREVAIKVLNAELNDPAVAKRFHAEAITVARLNHPGIATVYELFQNEGQWLMVMEFVRGETLEGLVTRKGPLSLDQAADISMQALGALAHAHSLGVVHRDLKPANLMFGDSGLVKIMDFGIARVAGTEHLTNAGFMMGTPAYMAPEQVLGEDIDARCDIYAMGAVLFHLLTGQLPFGGKSPFEMAQAHLRDQPILLRTVRLDMPEWAEQVIDRALQREPQQRFPSALVFHDALRRGLSGLPIDVVTSIPADIMVTAPPGGMPIVAPGTAANTSSTLPEPQMVETVLAASPQRSASIPPAPSIAPPPPAGPAAVPPQAASPLTPTAPARLPDGAADSVAVPSATMSGRSPASSRTALAIAAVVVLLIAAGVFVWMRDGSSAPPATAVSNPIDAPAAAQASTEAPDTDAAPVASAPSTETGAVAAPASETTPVADAPTSSAPPAAPRGTPTAGREGRGAAASRASAVAPVASAAAPLNTASAPAAPEVFSGVRVLVISGKKAEERPVSLRFGEGAISAVSERDGTTILSIPERDVSYSAYARAKDPRLMPILAAPPADTDFPGGLFRPARHWLTLQSRSSFLILRLNDADWRRVIDAVNRRTTVKVDTSVPSSK